MWNISVLILNNQKMLTMINDTLCSRDNSQAQPTNISDKDSQYAPTPGYYNGTPCYTLSPSPDYHLQDSHVVPSLDQQESTRLLQLHEWEAHEPHDEFPTNFIRYTIEWKVKVNNRFKSEDVIQNVVLAPSAYWLSVLKERLENVLQERVSRRRRLRSDDTAVIMSVNDRKHKNVKKRFNAVDVDWTQVEEQLLAWGKLYVQGKELRVAVTFNYFEDDCLSRSAIGGGDKRGKSSVTKRMLSERDVQIDAEEHISGQQSAWRAVYTLMRCPSPSCHLGPHCWQDPHGKKHYQLRTHHLKRLVAYVEGGGLIECQDDIPEAIREELYLEEQQRLDQSQSKSNKSLAVGSCPPININFMGGQPSVQPPVVNSIAPSVLPSQQESLIIDGPRDLAVKEYSAWQETNVIDETWKAQFQLACDITLANGLDLEQIHADQDPDFFVGNGVTVGIARRFVGDIMKWADDGRV